MGHGVFSCKGPRGPGRHCARRPQSRQAPCTQCPCGSQCLLDGVSGGGGLSRIQPMQSKTYAAAGIALVLALAGPGRYTRQAAQAPRFHTAAIGRGAVVASVRASGQVMPGRPGVGGHTGVGPDPRAVWLQLRPGSEARRHCTSIRNIEFQVHGPGRPGGRALAGAGGAGRVLASEGHGVARRWIWPGRARPAAQDRPGGAGFYRPERGRARPGPGAHQHRGLAAAAQAQSPPPQQAACRCRRHRSEACASAGGTGAGGDSTFRVTRASPRRWMASDGRTRGRGLGQTVGSQPAGAPELVCDCGRTAARHACARKRAMDQTDAGRPSLERAARFYRSMLLSPARTFDRPGGPGAQGGHCGCQQRGSPTRAAVRLPTATAPAARLIATARRD